jgi:dihydroflavonol-4-reductase
MSQLRALVLGGTGHIGQAVVREFLAQGYRVTATSRSARPEVLAGLDVEFMAWDSDSPGGLDACVRGQDVVIDTAAPYPLNLFVKTSAVERDPLGYARRRMGELLDAVARHRARLGYVSSFTTLPRNETGWAALEARWRRRVHPYFRVKQLMEELVLEAARSGLPSVIVNPTTCLGPWDTKPREHCLIPLLLSRAVPVTTQQLLNIIDVREVATGLRVALEAERYGEPIPLSGHNLHADALFRRICELGGKPPPRIPGSARLGTLALLGAEATLAWLGKPLPLPAVSGLLVCDSLERPPGRAQRALGVHVRPLDETLRDSIAWYRARGYC